MTIAILILAHILYLDDLIEIFKSNGKGNFLFSSTLLVLLTWDVSMPWGITVLSISGILLIIGIIKILLN